MTKDKSRIQSCIDHINTAVDVDPWAKELVIEMGKEVLERLNNSNEPSLTQKTLNVPDTNVGDMISRQAAIDVLAAMQGRCTSKAALIQNSKIWQQIKDLPSVQPVDKDINVSCKDAISRQGAIDICNNVIDLWQGQLGEGALVAIKNAINNLPSVQPYTDEEIQKIQELEQAQFDKAFELGKESARAEIVRCKDCIRYHQPSCLMAYDGKEWSEDNGFCHVGERKEDGFR